MRVYAFLNKTVNIYPCYRDRDRDRDRDREKKYNVAEQWNGLINRLIDTRHAITKCTCSDTEGKTYNSGFPIG